MFNMDGIPMRNLNCKNKNAFITCKNMLYLLYTIHLCCPCWCTDERTGVYVCVHTCALQAEWSWSNSLS